MRVSGESGRERAYQHLRSMVLTDPAVVDTFINEQEVASTVGVSRTPVREALLMLAAEDLVRMVPHRGAFVASLAGRQIAELMQSRALIECWAASSCIESAHAPVGAMSAALDRQQELLETGNARTFIEQDRQFHVLLVEAAGNSVLHALYESLLARHVLLGVVALHRSKTRRQEVLDEHRVIVQMLAAGDRERCEAAIRRHLETTRDVLTQG